MPGYGCVVHVVTCSPPVPRHPRRIQVGNPLIGLFSFGRPPLAAIVGTYHSINSKHVPRYLAEFEYRFNRRYDLAAMLPRLCWASVRTTPMPYRLLKLAEICA